MYKKTYSQLTFIFEMFRRNQLSPYHPIMSDLIKYDDIIEELFELRDDLKDTDKNDIEEIDALNEAIKELDARKKSQWRHMMERFVVNTHYYPYLEE